ncbi:hypothetical protein RhiirA4_391680 [Rhizophagus irregularis]|uniref:Crinkler effector protein N-terminal domain-containing protein n=1 Tax=Rhizophagus irregularis TaxID=588596 RepID=A0A2I1FV54_9GLOM|nr:hypothetical protein RhiirA4_391680 [Rhizophagus irregularis]
MSETNITIFCLVLGEKPINSCVFEVNINKYDSISRLKNVIRDEKKNDFFNIDANKLRLWKVDIPIIEDDKLKILNKPHTEINIEQELGGEELSSVKKIHHYFHKPKDEHIHIIITLPTNNIGKWYVFFEPANQQKIDDSMIKKEYEKVEKIAKDIGLDDWLLLIMSNCSNNTFKTNLPSKCTINDEIQFYDPSRDQIVDSQDKSCINSRVIDDIEQETVSDTIEFDEYNKRKFDDEEDLLIRTKFPRLSLDCAEDEPLKPLKQSVKILMY